MSHFDPGILPRGDLLRAAFPDQRLDFEGWGTLRCRLPGCKHKNGDRSPSLKVNAESGAYQCMTSGRKGNTWKAFVVAFWGEERWKEIVRQAFGRSGSGRKKTDEEHRIELRDHWKTLAPERAWTDRYGILPTLSGHYLRSGARYASDPVSETVVGIWHRRALVGAKWRLPAGEEWRVGAMKRDPLAKYALTKGSQVDVLFLEDRAKKFPDAALVVCAGEKDALVAASHLDPERWQPVSGHYSEGARRMPRGLRELARGRDVVVAYDGDDAGRGGTCKVWRYLKKEARSLRAAVLPDGEDLAEAFERAGPRAIFELLEAAVDEVPSSWWELPEAAGDPEEPEPQSQEARRKAFDTTHALDGWAEHGGATGVFRSEKGGGETFAIVLDGIGRREWIRKISTEDPDDPSGWHLEESIGLVFQLLDGRRVERIVAPGFDGFRKAFGQSDLDEAQSLGEVQLKKLHQWIARQSKGAPRHEEIRALGPYRDLGWLAPGGFRVRGGKVEEAPFEVTPPGDQEELRRFCLARAERSGLEELARWVLTDLLRCDFADQRYTLPLLGAFLQAPLWPRLRALKSFQRYVFWVQGESGSGKTLVCRHFWSFWGKFRRSSGLSTWSSSATYLESLLHLAKSCPVFIGDFKRGQFSRDEYRAAIRLIQGYADESSRGRARRGSGEVERKRPPRAAWIVDGEDLPEGEQSTLGRLCVLKVEPHAQRRLCADVLSLDPERFDQLPALTAEWIAWTQREEVRLTQHLTDALEELERSLAGGAANRSRIARNYAVQLATIWGFLDFLGDLGARDQTEDLYLKALEYAKADACAQLGEVQDESAAERFVDTLRVLLHSGALTLRPHRKGGGSGPRPFDHAEGPAQVAGTYHRRKAWIWPDVALSAVNAHLAKGGGRRIEFTQGAIERQLLNSTIQGIPYQRVEAFRDDRSRLHVWAMSLDELGAPDEEAAT